MNLSPAESTAVPPDESPSPQAQPQQPRHSPEMPAHWLPNKSAVLTRVPPDHRRKINRAILRCPNETYQKLYDTFELESYNVSFTSFYYYARRVRDAAYLAEMRQPSIDPNRRTADLIPEVIAEHLLDAAIDPKTSTHKLARMTRTFRVAQLALLTARRIESTIEDEKRRASRRETDDMYRSIRQFITLEHSRLRALSEPGARAMGAVFPPDPPDPSRAREEAGWVRSPDPATPETETDFPTPAQADTQSHRKMLTLQEQCDQLNCELEDALNELEKARAVFRSVGVDPYFVHPQSAQPAPDPIPPDPNREGEAPAEPFDPSPERLSQMDNERQRPSSLDPSTPASHAPERRVHTAPDLAQLSDFPDSASRRSANPQSDLPFTSRCDVKGIRNPQSRSHSPHAPSEPQAQARGMRRIKLSRAERKAKRKALAKAANKAAKNTSPHDTTGRLIFAGVGEQGAGLQSG